MKGLVIAIQFLTRLPTPRLAVSDAEFARSMRWFPVVGGLVGAIVAAAAWVGGRIDPWTGALAGLTAWVGVTGALHLDGLGDVADAAGAGHADPARIRAVLADPRVGSFAVVAIVLQLLAKLVLLRAAIADAAWTALAAAPFAARIAPLAWARWLPPLHEGLGTRFAAMPLGRALAGWAALLAVLALAVPALAAAVPVAWGWGLWLRARLGGLSGDGHGAGIEIVETGVLAAAAVLGALLPGARA